MKRIASIALIACVAVSCSSGNPVSPRTLRELQHQIRNGGNATTVGSVTTTFAVAIYSNLDQIDVTAYSDFVSADTSVVTVAEDGKVTAVGVGTTTVTVTYLDKTAQTTFFVR